MSRKPAASGLRSRRHVYTLIEALQDGCQLRERFSAPSNAEACARASAVIVGGHAELWRGRILIHAWGSPRAATPL